MQKVRHNQENLYKKLCDTQNWNLFAWIDKYKLASFSVIDWFSMIFNSADRLDPN